jgi:hypothetical protein
MDSKSHTPQKQAAPARRDQKDDRRPGRSGEGADSVLPFLKAWEKSRARARALKER